MTAKTKTISLAYLQRLKIDPDVYGVIDWLKNQWTENGELDIKYTRRVLEALIILKGGKP
jgi:hypothetical protein